MISRRNVLVKYSCIFPVEGKHDIHAIGYVVGVNSIQWKCLQERFYIRLLSSFFLFFLILTNFTLIFFVHCSHTFFYLLIPLVYCSFYHTLTCIFTFCYRSQNKTFMPCQMFSFWTFRVVATINLNSFVELQNCCKLLQDFADNLFLLV